jgi:hypothetical protein
MFLGLIHGYAERCPTPDGLADWTPGWLRHAVAYRVDDNTPALLDADGRIVARLMPGGLPTPNTKLVMPEEAQPPVLDDEMRQALTEPEGEPPAGRTPATPEQLVGRWVPPKGTGANPAVFLELTADGISQASDGCNHTTGRWLAGDSGRILAIGGPTTLVGCSGMRPVADWLAAASYAFFDGPTLVLLDSTGAETGRLVREASFSEPAAGGPDLASAPNWAAPKPLSETTIEAMRAGGTNVTPAGTTSAPTPAISQATAVGSAGDAFFWTKGRQPSEVGLAVVTVTDYGKGNPDPKAPASLELYIENRPTWVVVFDDVQLPVFGPYYPPGSPRPTTAGWYTARFFLLVDAQSGEVLMAESL